ncbi:nuclear transport factor 2 family protein [Acidocella sp.]|uniref:nuclear transport factor 2 family protein n=1 Tax=Acidocella sp. TaxID=50710 RepID=UPI0026077D55|nr:nuclear transport factor 2 family protein [Acidocella sp.]
MNETALANLLAKDAIRELGMLYSRGVDRKDAALLRSLYTADATDTHGDTFDGGAEAYVDFLESSFPYMPYSGHHICNHLISVEGDTGEGEVYAYAFHIIPDGKGGWLEDGMFVRYLDHYRKEDGRWRFAKRVVTYDCSFRRPAALQERHAFTVPVEPTAYPGDASYATLTSRLFARGGRG